MDKRLVGKWYKEEMGETINIFDENPPRMKMSFSSTGYYHFEPNCVYEKGEYLCFEINDEKYRMVYHVQFVEDHLEGYYTQFGKDTPVRYTLVSNEPEDKPYQFIPTKIFVPETGESRIELLKKYEAYDRVQQHPYETKYVLGKKLPHILKNYGFSEYVEGISEKSDEIAFKVLDFVCDHFGHDGSGGMSSDGKIKNLIGFCEKHNSKTNCRGLSMLLASLLRACSVKARHITCMPYEDPFNDCHVVVDCLLPSGKRVMLDPTWRLFLKDSGGEYVSLERLRKMLIAGEPFFANENAAYNKSEAFDPEYYREYMTKNTFRFSRGTFYDDGCDDSAARRVELIPANYPVEEFGAQAKKEFVYDDVEFWKM